MPWTLTALVQWRHYPRYYDVTTSLLWRHYLATMTSLPPLLWRHYPRYYDVTTLATMTSLPSLLWRHYPRYYDVTNPSTMTSLPPLLWRHYPLYYDVTTLVLITILSTNTITNSATITSLPRYHPPLTYYAVTTPLPFPSDILCRHYTATIPLWHITQVRANLVMSGRVSGTVLPRYLLRH